MRISDWSSDVCSSDLISQRTQMPLRPNQLSYWRNYSKFHVSLMKAWWGDAATAENNWTYDYLPKVDRHNALLQAYEHMQQGKMKGKSEARRGGKERYSTCRSRWAA